jgi:hypothetical protein
MKKKLTYLLSILFVCSLVLLTNCDKDDDDPAVELTEQQKAAKALADGSPWQVTTVVSKPEETTDESPLLSLELSFDVSGTEAEKNIAPSSFEASSEGDFFTSENDATWAWSGSNTSAITLTGASEAELTNIQYSPDSENPTSVTLTFELTSLGGRVKGLGEYTVILE